jgi:DNA-binding GntR family transcriptional regulator
LAAKLTPIGLPQTLKDQVYLILKGAIANMDINSTPEPPKLDERRLAKALGVSRAPQPAESLQAH